MLKQLGLQSARTSRNYGFWLWTLYGAVVKLGMEWALRITDGGSDSGRPGKFAESFGAYVSARPTIRTSPKSVAGPTR